MASLPCRWGELDPDLWAYSKDAAVVSSVYKTTPSPEQLTIPRSPDWGRDLALKMFARRAMLYWTSTCPCRGFVTIICWSSDQDWRYQVILFLFQKPSNCQTIKPNSILAHDHFSNRCYSMLFAKTKIFHGLCTIRTLPLAPNCFFSRYYTFNLQIK